MNDHDETAAAMRVELHIERLVLDGLEVAPGQGDRLRGAVAAELGRLLRQGALAPALAAGGARPHLAGGVLRPAAEGGGARLGRQIARAAYDGLGPGRKVTKP